jgi:hypothetical protein
MKEIALPQTYASEKPSVPLFLTKVIDLEAYRSRISAVRPKPAILRPSAAAAIEDLVRKDPVGNLIGFPIPRESSEPDFDDAA